ncbi:MAG: DUF5606 domain-containing protein, partial [Flavobacteriales bacterium]
PPFFIKHNNSLFFYRIFILLSRPPQKGTTFNFDIPMKVTLEKILSVSGKPGIYQLIAGGKSIIIAESLVDGKRMPIHPSQRVSSLSDISIFTIEEDVPLKDVFEKMKEHYKGAAAPDHKSEGKTLRTEMEKFLPTYDAERVYDSDIKKLFQWYNILQAKDMLEFEEAQEESTEEN